MSAVNVVVFIHGMTPDKDSSDSAAAFISFWDRLCAFKPELRRVFPDHHVQFVSWGHEPQSHSGPLRPDQKLTYAEKNVAARVEYGNVRRSTSPANVLMTGLFGRDYNLPGLRGVLVGLRENIVQYGLSDVVYYCSEEGEKQVRVVVYGQVLELLRKFKQDENDICLHVVGHSLGVTISHDFLFGLFKKNHSPDFLKQADEQDEKDYEYWRKAAVEGRLTVGSFTSMASQLPLFAMRNGVMIDIFHRNGQLNLKDIGITGEGVIWQIFYDVDDVLGFASRDLYADPGNCIRQVQVNSGSMAGAHTGYTTNRTVIERTASLLLANSL